MDCLSGGVRLHQPWSDETVGKWKGVMGHVLLCGDRRRGLPLVSNRVLGPRPRADPVFNSVTYCAALVIVALFLLGVVAALAPGSDATVLPSSALLRLWVLVAAIIYFRGGSRVELVGAIGGPAGALHLYNMGILFVPLPIPCLLVHRGRTTVNRLRRLYAAVVVANTLCRLAPGCRWVNWGGGTGGLALSTGCCNCV